MTKLIIQIPCYNEEETLPLVLASIPKHIDGIDTIETLIIDDGSTDKTIEVAEQHGVDHIVRHKKNRGLAASFMDGLDECLKQGADIIVNTDGDNQYPQAEIGRLVTPIVEGEYDIVIGDRQTHLIEHFSPVKKVLQRLGSHMVQRLAGISVNDAPSGFRAYSREAAMRMNLVTNFSYVIETIIQAGKKRIAITHIPIFTNAKTRESRLFKNIFQHVRKSTASMVRSYAMYEPLKVFSRISLLLFVLGISPIVRFLYLSIKFNALISGHIQSILAGGVLIILSVIALLIGIVSDLLAINRKLHEETLYRIKKMQYEKE